MKDELICTICPIGCGLAVEHDEDKIITVAGYQCKRGPEYAQKEIFDPQRMVTTTMRIIGAGVSLLPVKTAGTVPKNMTLDVVREIAGRTVCAPIRAGEVVLENIAGTQVAVVATRSLERSS